MSLLLDEVTTTNIQRREAITVEREAEQTTTTKRVSIDFAVPAYDRLRVLKEQTHATTLSAVIRDALRIYMWAIEQQQDGYKVAAIKEIGNQLILKEPTLP